MENDENPKGAGLSGVKKKRLFDTCMTHATPIQNEIDMTKRKMHLNAMGSGDVAKDGRLLIEASIYFHEIVDPGTTLTHGAVRMTYEQWQEVRKTGDDLFGGLHKVLTERALGK